MLHNKSLSICNIVAVLARQRPDSRTLAPGLAMAAGCTVLAFVINDRVPSVSPLTAGVALGALIGNIGLMPRAARPGLAFAAQVFLRAGIVLLGLQLGLGDVIGLGARPLMAVTSVVAITFVSCRLLARRMGLSEGMGLLVATGYGICGVSAVSAMKEVVDADEDDAAYAIALVTLCGSLSIALLPVLGSALGLTDGVFGAWVGAAVHDVAQVVATASSRSSDETLHIAVVVKLTRVVLLAPLVALMAIAHRRAASHGRTGKRPPLLPPFVIGFLVAVAVASTGWLPANVQDGARNFERILLTMALVGLGAGVDVRRMARLGGRPLAFGMAAWVLVMGASLAAVSAAGIGR